jgi:hypothetical protein
MTVMDVKLREPHDPRRCAYCHDDLDAVPDPSSVAACERCGAHVHLACWQEHGACPVLGCAPAAGPQLVT